MAQDEHEVATWLIQAVHGKLQDIHMLFVALRKYPAKHEVQRLELVGEQLAHLLPVVQALQ